MITASMSVSYVSSNMICEVLWQCCSTWDKPDDGEASDSETSLTNSKQFTTLLILIMV